MSLATPRRRSRRSALALAAVACGAGLTGAGAVAAGLLAAGAVHRAGGTTTVVRQVTVTSPAATVTSTTTTASPPAPARAVFARAAAGTVAITAKVEARVPSPFGDRTETGEQTGSGVVLDASGHVLTAEHVVSGATSISVKLLDGTTRAATLLGRDSATDAAVLRIDPRGLTLTPLPLGSVRALRVGDPLYVIGGPFGYAWSLSTGVVSGLDRTIEAPNGFTVAHAVQTDAALNPGNSGGPLLDAAGRVVGIADQIATGGTSAQTSTGVAFAVPIDVVRSALSSLERGVTPRHAYLGVGTADAAAGGALIDQVRAASPAAQAGLRAGDRIVEAGGDRISASSDLVAAIASRRPGESLALVVRRGTSELRLTVTLGSEPATATTG